MNKLRTALFVVPSTMAISGIARAQEVAPGVAELATVKTNATALVSAVIAVVMVGLGLALFLKYGRKAS